MRILLIIFTLISFTSCDKQVDVQQVVTDSACYKGKLMLVGLCGNAVVQVLDDRMNPSFYEKTWKDESTGIVYQNVMGNANYCSFPGNLKEGQEFYFRIDPPTSLPPDCVNCKALSPTPQTRQYIQICSSANK
ncbi:MAG: hypothetical protein ACK492_07760 [Chitinophagaceae bacterium]|jgi:hypothetical protein